MKIAKLPAGSTLAFLATAPMARALIDETLFSLDVLVRQPAAVDCTL